MSLLPFLRYNSLNKIVKDDVNNVVTLQQQFNNFMDQQFKKRRDADDVSVALTGFTNQQRYENQIKDLVQEEYKKQKVAS